MTHVNGVPILTSHVAHAHFGSVYQRTTDRKSVRPTELEATGPKIHPFHFFIAMAVGTKKWQRFKCRGGKQKTSPSAPRSPIDRPSRLRPRLRPALRRHFHSRKRVLWISCYLRWLCGTDGLAWFSVCVLLTVDPLLSLFDDVTESAVTETAFDEKIGEFREGHAEEKCLIGA